MNNTEAKKCTDPKYPHYNLEKNKCCTDIKCDDYIQLQHTIKYSKLPLEVTKDIASSFSTKNTYVGENLDCVTFEVKGSDEPLDVEIYEKIKSSNGEEHTTYKVSKFIGGGSYGQVISYEDEKGNKVPNNFFPSSALINYEPAAKLQRAGISSYMNSLYKKELQRKDWLLYAITPNTGDDFKRSLRQFKVNKDKVVLTVIYSKTK